MYRIFTPQSSRISFYGFHCHRNVIVTTLIQMFSNISPHVCVNVFLMPISSFLNCSVDIKSSHFYMLYVSLYKRDIHKSGRSLCRHYSNDK